MMTNAWPIVKAEAREGTRDTSSIGESRMLELIARVTVAVCFLVLMVAGCTGPVQPEKVSGKDRCIGAGGVWRAGELCEYPEKK